MNKRGGKREGAGPKPKPEHLKKKRRVLYLTDSEYAELLKLLPSIKTPSSNE